MDTDVRNRKKKSNNKSNGSTTKTSLIEEDTLKTVNSQGKRDSVSTFLLLVINFVFHKVHYNYAEE